MNTLAAAMYAWFSNAGRNYWLCCHVRLLRYLQRVEYPKRKNFCDPSDVYRRRTGARVASPAPVTTSKVISGANRMFRQRFGGPGETISREALEGSLLLFDPGAKFYATWQETQAFFARWAATTSKGDGNDSYSGTCKCVSLRFNYVNWRFRCFPVPNPGLGA